MQCLHHSDNCWLFCEFCCVDWAMLGFSFEECIVRCLESSKKSKTQSLLQGAEQACLFTY